MKSLFIVLVTFSTLSIGVPRIWLVGTQAVQLVSPSQTLHSWPQGTETSAFDAKHCQLWAANDENLNLYSAKGDTLASLPFAGEILSGVFEEKFVTTDKNRWQVRASSTGTLLLDVALPFQTQKIYLGKSFHWALEETANTLTLYKLAPDFSVAAHWNVSAGADLWGTHEVWVNEAKEEVWIGYAMTTPFHIYSPVVERRSYSGHILQKVVFSERGLFFGFSGLPDGSVLAARDIPSDSGFTVPVYSYLERFTDQVSPPKRYFGAHENRFIDSLAVGSDALWMLQRSIFGSDGSRLVRWNPKVPDAAWPVGEDLLKVPNTTQKLYLCE